jgi:hypothetical protein
MLGMALLSALGVLACGARRASSRHHPMGSERLQRHAQGVHQVQSLRPPRRGYGAVPCMGWDVCAVGAVSG